MPLTPKPPFEIMAPVEFDIEVVVLLATNIFEYITFAPAIIPPAPAPVVNVVLTNKLVTLSCDVVLLNVREAFEPKEPASLNWISVVRPAGCVVLIEPRVFDAVL